jgi:hypothetical protein
MPQRLAFALGRLAMVLALGSAAWLASCGGESLRDDGTGGSAGSSTTGGKVGTGGTLGTGGLVSTGGTFGVGGLMGTGGTDCSPTIPGIEACLTKLGVETAVILDYEDGSIGDYTTTGMYTYAEPDANAVPPGNGGTISPSPSAPELGLTKTGGANGTSNFFHSTGIGFKAASYGGGFGIWLACTDASAVDGVRFYYKSDQALNVTIDNTHNVSYLQQGKCCGDFDACVQWGEEIPAVSLWTEVSIAWGDLTGGMPAAFDTTEVIGIDFAIVVPANAVDGWGWDVSLDEVEWLGGPAGSGGATGVGGASSGAGGA